MVDGKIGVAGLKLCHRGKRHQFTGRAGFDVDFLESGWIGEESGIGLQHDVVLIEPAVQSRDLPLAEAVIEGVVNCRRRDPSVVLNPSGIGAGALRSDIKQAAMPNQAPDDVVGMASNADARRRSGGADVRKINRRPVS